MVKKEEVEMKNSLIKFLPIAAAVMLATSCSKDDNDNAPATQSGSDGVETVTANTIPFSIRVNTGHSLKKVGYAESTNEGEKGRYNITFSDNDVDKLEMKIYTGEITDESNLLTTLTLKNATTGEFTGTVETAPAADADLTTDGNSLGNLLRQIAPRPSRNLRPQIHRHIQIRRGRSNPHRPERLLGNHDVEIPAQTRR